MADETPDAPVTPQRRRRGPNKPKPEGSVPVRRGRAARSIAATAASTADLAEHPATEAASKSTAAMKGAAKSAVKAAKPRAGKRATPRTAAKPAARRKRRIGVGAIAGGLAAVGAATAAVFALRGGGKKNKSVPSAPPLNPSAVAEATAHQADGADSSKSFDAGIADEGTIPDTI